jgi:hypothetical protein
VSRLITAWAVGEAATGERWISAEVFLASEWNRVAAEYKRPTLYRDLKTFRDLFPQWDTPGQLIDATPALRRAVRGVSEVDATTAVFNVEWVV